MTHMDDKTNLTPEQDEVQTGEEVSFTISGEDAAAQEALNAKKTAKKKSPLPWIIGGAAVVVAAALVLILTLKPKTVSPAAQPPRAGTLYAPAATPPTRMQSSPAMRRSPSLPIPLTAPTAPSRTIRHRRKTARQVSRRTANRQSRPATA